MKKFTVIHNFTAVASIEVLAETREEAFEKAKENDLELSDYDFELDSADIGHEETAPDLQELISKACKILKKYEEEKRDTWFYMPIYPTITTMSWDGYTYTKHRDITEDFYYEPDKGLIMYDSKGLEVELDELSEIEQMNVCQSIIDAAPLNGIDL